MEALLWPHNSRLNYKSNVRFEKTAKKAGVYVPGSLPGTKGLSRILWFLST
jgi:hypothetical protein